MDLSSLRADAEQLTVELARAPSPTRHPGPPGKGLAAIYAAYAHVISPEALQLVREARAAAAAPEEARRARRLESLAAHLLGLQASSRAADEIDAAERTHAAIEVVGIEPGERLSVREAHRRVAREAGRDARGQLASRLSIALADLDAAGAHAIEAWHVTAQRAGFADPIDAMKSLVGVDARAIAAEAAQFLSATDAMYADVLSWWLRKTLGIKPHPHGAESHDLAHAFGPPAHEGAFAGCDATTLLRRLDALGFDPKHRALDMPAGRGLVDAANFLARAGTAVHFAHISPDRPFEDHLAGDPAVGLATGLLFANWILDRKWLARVLEVEGPDLVRVFALWRLSWLRQLAANARHDASLLADGPRAGSGEAWAELASAATLARTPQGGAMYRSRDPWWAIHLWRAAGLEAALFESFRARFDEDWWLNPRCGAFLAKHFESGAFELSETHAGRLAPAASRPQQLAARLEALLV